MTARIGKIRRRLLIASVAAAAFGAPQLASASIIYESPYSQTGTGFGNEPRLLTLQETGPRRDGTESACAGVGAGGATTVGSGSCIGDSQVFRGNGVTNTGGDEVNPMRDGNKYNTPTIGDAGLQSAADIGLVFNATDPAGDAITIDDVTLKFYLDGQLLAAIDGNMMLDPTVSGNGRADYLLTVDAEQQAFLNERVFSLPNFGDVQLALESTISGAAGGPESFWLVNLGRTTGGSTGGTPVPAPAGLALFALGAAGLIARRRRRAA
jgi:hypothetical protein